jgi:UDP-N-acetylmuramoyl-tripeptide--D-alanyl-D-alanine ligase
MEINQLYELFKQSTGVTTDTRNIKQNQLFFALKGDSFNGNTFAEKALEIGASYTIIDENEFQQNDKCILVSDVLQTLQQLANYHLHQINPKHILV